MAADALAGWQTDVAAGRDAVLIADTWEMADALNMRIHGATIAADSPIVLGARGYRIGVGDVIIARRNDPSVEVYDATDINTLAADPVRNGNRWTVYAVDPDNDRIAARRIGDRARAVLAGDYLAEHVHHGFAVTVHAAQGATADTTHAVLGESASRAAAYRPGPRRSIGRTECRRNRSGAVVHRQTLGVSKDGPAGAGGHARLCPNGRHRRRGRD